MSNQNQEKKSKKYLPLILGIFGGAAVITGATLIGIYATKPAKPEEDTRITITYNVGSAIIVNGSNTVKVEPNTEFGSINKPVIESNGKIFAGWYKDANLETKVLDTDKISSSTTIYAKFVDDTTIYIDFSAGDTGATITGITKVAVEATTKFNEINKPIASWTGGKKTFRAWQNGGYDVEGTTTFSKSTRLTPGYDEATEKLAHVTYKIKTEDQSSAHYEGLYEYTVAAGTLFQTTTKPTPVHNAKQFNKWVMSDGAGGYKDVPTSYSLPEGDSDFYAEFGDVELKQKITIKLSGESYYLSNETDTTGDLIFIKGDGTKKSYKRDEFNEQVIIGEDRKSIDINFLFNCTAFNNGGQKLVIPDNVEQIGAAFMHNCKSFNQEIVLPKNIKLIGNSFLQKCESFNSKITFPSTVPADFYIGNYFLFECSSFDQEIALPKELTVISGSFLEGCSSYNNGGQPFVFPTSLTAINSYFLARCSSFNQALSIPNTVSQIAEDFLYNCSAYNSALTLPTNAGFKQIEDAFLTGCKSFNQSYTLPTSITQIGDYFMYSCEAFNKLLTLPTNLTSIGMYFMSRCIEFNQNITIDQSIVSPNVIGVGFMYYCNNMVGTITVNCNYQCFTTSAYTLATGSPHASCYQTGITIGGTGGTSNFLSRFSNNTKNPPYRNLKSAS